MAHANNTLKFKVKLSDGSGLDGTMRCTDEQWNAIFPILIGKVPPSVVEQAMSQKGTADE